MFKANMPIRIPMPCPFAGKGVVEEIKASAGNDVNFQDGFPAIYSTPGTNGGRYVSRAEMNALGNIATNDLFYHKCGGINTFDPLLCTQIGGYPKGAILDYFDGVNLNKVLSLEDNNTQDFRQGVFANKWMLLNSPEPNLGQITIGKWTMTGSSVFPSNVVSIASFVSPKSGSVICNVSNMQYGINTANYDKDFFSGACVLAISSTSSDIPTPSPASYGSWKNVFQLPGGKTNDITSGVVTCAAGNFVSICYQNGYGGMTNYSFDIEVSIL